jgi:hypothetical protein
VRDLILDDFEDLSGWKPFAPGKAELAISRDEGVKGKAMRLDFDFHGGGGFVVARKELALEIPESYSLGFRVRGAAPRNHFEFKLIDDTNRNVWRYRAEAFDFPGEWRPVRIRGSRIEFAWGPLGGGPPRDIAALELVIAAGPGGRGTVWFEELRLRDETYRSTPRVTASGSLPGHEPQNVVNFSEASSWRSGVPDRPHWLQIDFGQEREFGGLVIHWEDGLRGREFEAEVSSDGAMWKRVYATSQADSDRSYLFLPETVARYVRLRLNRSSGGLGFGIRGVEVKPHDFSRSLNHFFEAVARDHRAGLYPKYLLGRQTYWTPAGTVRGEGQALLNEEGMVEVAKGSFSIAPFLFDAGRLITWADAQLVQNLERGCLPIPSAQWRTDRLAMKVTVYTAGFSGRPVVYLRYRIENLTPQGLSVRFFAAILPFQVTPTWQNWRSFGGASPIRELTFRGGAVRIDGEKAVILSTEAAGFGSAAFAQGGVVQSLAEGELPQRADVKDEFGFASGAFRFDLELAPQAAGEVALAVPSYRMQEVGEVLPSPSEAFRDAVTDWEAALEAVEIRLPGRAQAIPCCLKTAAAHILVNRDGPALQPGPRRYARSWIRDGAVMGASLLRLGHTEPIRDFIRWYKGFQDEDGRIPDCVDREGAEWLPEFDAYGQFIYAVMEYYRFTRDRGFLEELRPAVAKTLALVEGLLAQRLTEEYRGPEKCAFYGILPESMSHEGYMAHPVHAYWDDFWALRGFRDAAAMAEILGDGAEAERLARVRDRFSEDLRSSLRAAIARHRIDYVPGSVELGDFDPAATSVALSPLDELAVLPRPEINRTFDKYMAGFRQRCSGAVEWSNYSAYEIRIIGALVRLGRREEALELTRFMLDDRRIPAWNQWPEISWRDPRSPSFLGDLPHAWISAEYILAIRSLFAYEREEDDSLVVAAGVDPAWLKEGFTVEVGCLPTHHGSLSYRMRLEDAETLRISLDGDLEVPGGGLVLQPPLSGPIRKVELGGRPLAAFSADSFTCRQCPCEAVVRV